jgi:hypothetical protein
LNGEDLYTEDNATILKTLFPGFEKQIDFFGMTKASQYSKILEDSLVAFSDKTYSSGNYIFVRQNRIRNTVPHNLHVFLCRCELMVKDGKTRAEAVAIQLGKISKVLTVAVMMQLISLMETY